MVGLVLVVLFVFWPYSPIFWRLIRMTRRDFSKVLQFPFKDPSHPLGTDEVGRDFLSRLIYGARTSMTVGLAVQVHRLWDWRSAGCAGGLSRRHV